jgi:hypothetical protein
LRCSRSLVTSLMVLASLSGCDNDDQPRADLRCLGEPVEGFEVQIRECAVGTCNDGLFCNGFETCQGRETDGGSSLICQCAAGTPPCRADQQCDEETEECLECGIPDRDEDQFDSIECGGIDCNDDDPLISPDAPEICDAAGVDEDCDPLTIGGEDRDGDGFISADCFNVLVDGGENRGQDCDDSNPAAGPLQVEACNGIDDDCDGDIDEGLLAPLYEDADNDGFGIGPSTLACAPAAGRSLVAGDCDDTRASIHPDAIRCMEGGQGIEYMICLEDGTWQTAICPDQGRCVPQPNGTGVCIN